MVTVRKGGVVWPTMATLHAKTDLKTRVLTVFGVCVGMALATILMILRNGDGFVATQCGYTLKTFKPTA